MATRQREKSAKIAATRDKRPTAIAKSIRIPAGKVEIVLDLIRGKSYEQAVAILQNTNKSACEPLLKVLNSAAANAENNLNLSKDALFVAECWAGPGMTMKRMMPRARGRADRILKHTCHITIILDERKDTTKPQPKKAEKAKSEVKPVKSTPTPKPVPKTPAESPTTKTPNAKKPLGTKKVAVADVKKAGVTPKVATTKSRATQAKKDTKGGSK